MKKNKTVLIVEDEEPLSNAIKEKCEKSGLKTLTARSVDQAMVYFEGGKRIDAVWLDHYLLGGGSGLDLATRIKNGDSEWKNIPIFVVSNTASAEKVKNYMSLGIYGYYTKADFRLDHIVGDINNCLK